MNGELKKERLLVTLIVMGSVSSLMTVIWLTWFCCSTTLDNQEFTASEVRIRGLRSRLERSHQSMIAAISLRAAGGNQEWAAEYDRARARLGRDLESLAQLTSIADSDRTKIDQAVDSFDTVSDLVFQDVVDEGPEKALAHWLIPVASTQQQELRRALTTAVYYCDKAILAVQDAQDERVGQVIAASVGSTVILTLMLLVGIGRIRNHIYRQALIERTLLAQTIELTELKLVAESASEAKSNFLASTSHELRTPLTTILGYADQLFEQLSTDKERRMVDTMRLRGRGLLQLINDLLDLARIESGNISLELSLNSPWKIATAVADMLRVQADTKSLVLETRCDGPIPRQIRTDPARLEQILLNFVNNAVKYTDVGHVRITLSYADDSRELRFVVADTGQGIPEDYVSELFVPFARGAADRSQEGTGLGLAISQQLSDLLNGTISLKSTLGTGSEFALTLPVEESVPVDLYTPENHVVQDFDSSEVSGNQRPSLDGLSVLIVEDDPVNCLMLKTLLEHEGATTESSADGADAIKRVRQGRSSGESIDLIFMDMGLPVVDGYVATKKIRKDGFLGGIIALTANVRTADRQKSLECGCNQFISKPFDRGKLLKLVSEYTNR